MSILKNEVTESFRRFLKKVRLEAEVTTRELANVIGKSPMYISQLENGKVKTIKFDTAMAILEYIYRKKPFISGSMNGDDSPNGLIFNMLVNTFMIKPEQWYEDEIERNKQEQERFMKELERIDMKFDLLKTMIKVEDIELVDVMLKIGKLDREYLGFYTVDFLNSILDMLEDKDYIHLLFLINLGCQTLRNELWVKPFEISEKDKEFLKKLQNLIIEYTNFKGE